ncbi:hypothetical protein CsSME_00030115 [Camellia sinensis var. sinensis]
MGVSHQPPGYYSGNLYHFTPKQVLFVMFNPSEVFADIMTCGLHCIYNLCSIVLQTFTSNASRERNRNFSGKSNRFP